MALFCTDRWCKRIHNARRFFRAQTGGWSDDRTRGCPGVVFRWMYICMLDLEFCSDRQIVGRTDPIRYYGADACMPVTRLRSDRRVDKETVWIWNGGVDLCTPAMGLCVDRRMEGPYRVLRCWQTGAHIPTIR